MCNPCDQYCSNCTGPKISQCGGCFEPYQLHKTTCVYNATLAKTMKVVVKPHVKFWRHVRHVCYALLLLLVLILIGWCIYRMILSWAQGREYSKFDGPDLTSDEIS